MRSGMGKYVVRLSSTKMDLASRLGTISITFSRTLNYFKKKKFILEQNSEFVIIDLMALKGLI